MCLKCVVHTGWCRSLAKPPFIQVIWVYNEVRDYREEPLRPKALLKCRPQPGKGVHIPLKLVQQAKRIHNMVLY